MVPEVTGRQTDGDNWLDKRLYHMWRKTGSQRQLAKQEAQLSPRDRAMRRVS